MKRFSGQSNTDLTISYPKVVRRLVILETHDAAPKAHSPIKYNLQKSEQYSRVRTSNDPYTLNELLAIPTENFLFSSAELDHVIQEDAVPSWTYL